MSKDTRERKKRIRYSMLLYFSFFRIFMDIIVIYADKKL